MARLILSLDNQVLAEYNMSKERYTIGRLPDNDVRIDNPAVSGHHSLIINILNDSFLEDLNSTNGTYVNGKLIKKHALQNGDVITIGHHQMRFSDHDALPVEQDDFEKTMVIPAGQQDAEQLIQAEKAAEEAVAEAKAAESAPGARYEAAAAAVKLGPDEAEDLNEGDLDEAVEFDEPMPEPTAPPPPAEPVAEMQVELPPSSTQTGIDPMNAPSALPMGTLQVLSGGFAGRELELTKALTTLGRPGIQVAAVTRRKEGYYIVHVESGKEGDFPLVNGDPIGSQARKLTDNDVVQLAGVKMGFYLS
jgi:pSer/pThr/pTyr-binding forkhead associated (FHA) protein